MDEPLILAYEVWGNITDVLNRKPLLYYSQHKYSLALLNLRHLFEIYYLFSTTMRMEMLQALFPFFYLYSCATAGTGYLTDPVWKAQSRLIFIVFLYITFGGIKCEHILILQIQF